LVLAWAMYPTDNDGSLVLNGGDLTTTPAPNKPPHLWVYGGDHNDPQTFTNISFLLGPQCALFAPALPSPGIYKCPADQKAWAITGEPEIQVRSYAMNCYIGTPPANVVSPLPTALMLSNPPWRVYMKSRDLESDAPSGRFVFMDVNPGSICTPAFGVDMTGETFIHFPSGMHGPLGIVVFADGHEETHRWLDSRTMVTTAAYGQYIPHDIGSANNKDLEWIVAQTSVAQ